LTSDSLPAHVEADRFYSIVHGNPWDDASEEFGVCQEGVEDLRSWNAALHDFHEVLTVPLCAVLGDGQNAMDIAVFGKA
jgi:hypothetical protein